MELELKDIFKSVFRHIVMIATVTFLVTAIAAYVSWNRLPKTYTAETTLYVIYRSSDEVLYYSNVSLSELLINDYSELVKSNRVIESVAISLGLPLSEVRSSFKIEVKTSSTNRFLKLQVTGENPVQAANIANALATELARCVLDVTNITNINVVDVAKVPTVPSGPQPLKITGIAGALALMVTIFLAILIDSINIRITSREDVQSILGISVLAQIPLDNSK